MSANASKFPSSSVRTERFCITRSRGGETCRFLQGWRSERRCARGTLFGWRGSPRLSARVPHIWDFRKSFGLVGGLLVSVPGKHWWRRSSSPQRRFPLGNRSPPGRLTPSERGRTVGQRTPSSAAFEFFSSMQFAWCGRHHCLVSYMKISGIVAALLNLHRRQRGRWRRLYGTGILATAVSEAEAARSALLRVTGDGIGGTVR